MKILIACECSGVVRRAFARHGHEVFSCDLQQSRDNSMMHLVGDVRQFINMGWDLMIAHPPCTYLSYAGARWWKRDDYIINRDLALDLFRVLLNAPIDRIAVENPRGIAAKLIRKPDQAIEPFMFGQPYKKRTYLWLKNLPPLMATVICADYEVNWTAHVTKDRAYTRSKTFSGIAEAMAKQWG